MKNIELYRDLICNLNKTNSLMNSLKLIYQFYLDLDITKVSQDKNVILLMFYKIKEGLCSFIWGIGISSHKRESILCFQEKLFSKYYSCNLYPFGKEEYLKHKIDKNQYEHEERLNWINSVLNGEYDNVL